MSVIQIGFVNKEGYQFSFKEFVERAWVIVARWLSQSQGVEGAQAFALHIVQRFRPSLLPSSASLNNRRFIQELRRWQTDETELSLRGSTIVVRRVK